MAKATRTLALLRSLDDAAWTADRMPAWHIRAMYQHVLGACEAGASIRENVRHDVVAEWARRHGKPFLLDLTGPAGGTYAHDPELPEAEHLSLDPVEFCRALAGRGHPAGLLTTIVPF